THVLVCFRSVWMHLSMFCYYMKLGAKRVELVQLSTSLCHKVASEFFAKNALDPPHWNQTHVLEHFVVCRCIWQCFVISRNSVQNRLNWCNECTRSTPWDTKLMNRCVL